MQKQMDEAVRIAHLQMIQGVVARMNVNSFGLKTASVTLVAGCSHTTGRCRAPPSSSGWEARS
jgi:hypothetical protein